MTRSSSKSSAVRFLELKSGRRIKLDPAVRSKPSAPASPDRLIPEQCTGNRHSGSHAAAATRARKGGERHAAAMGRKP